MRASARTDALIETMNTPRELAQVAALAGRLGLTLVQEQYQESTGSWWMRARLTSGDHAFMRHAIADLVALSSLSSGESPERVLAEVRRAIEERKLVLDEPVSVTIDRAILPPAE